MKLYHYDHCPYCLRVRLAAGLLGLNLPLEALANDDEATPIGLVGQKMLPILQREDGTAMAESLDIVAHLDADGRLAPAQASTEALLQRIGEYSALLLYPRMLRLPLPEFASAAARDYFQGKKSERIGDFAQALAQTEQHLDALNRDLAAAAEQLGDKRFLGGEQGSLDDVLLFPVLRNLTAVRGAQYPENLRQYLERLAAAAQIDLFFSQQI